MNHLDLVYKGSTKDIFSDKESLYFFFSDRYSVFDWGEMPDHIPGKGASLLRFNHSIFSFLESQGFSTHRVGAENSRNLMRVKPYASLADNEKQKYWEDVFIPLEVIFRHGVPEGSSLLKRMPNLEAGMQLKEPLIEFTTKRERLDRLLNPAEAYEMSGLTEKEWELLNLTAVRIAVALRDFFSQHGLVLWDGKVELGAGKRVQGIREIVLVDSIGPDELRLSYQGMPVSKEVIRQFYLKTPWGQSLAKLKQEHGEDFKSFATAPEPLPKNFLNAVAEMYQRLADMLETGLQSEDSLGGTLQRLRSYL